MSQKKSPSSAIGLRPISIPTTRTPSATTPIIDIKSAQTPKISIVPKIATQPTQRIIPRINIGFPASPFPIGPSGPRGRTVLPPSPPPFKLGIEFELRETKSKKRKKYNKGLQSLFNPQYAPSLRAKFFGITGKAPKVITGLETRPIIIKWNI